MRHRDAIALSMIDGKKETSEPATAIPSSRRLAAIILIALVISSGLYLYKNFDPQTRTLTLFGQTLQLGENENEAEAENEHE